MHYGGKVQAPENFKSILVTCKVQSGRVWQVRLVIVVSCFGADVTDIKYMFAGSWVRSIQ